MVVQTSSQPLQVVARRILHQLSNNHLSGCLFRDISPAHTAYQGLVTTVVAATATTIAADNRKRWTEEEVFMTLTRYWRFADLTPCRPGVAWALVLFALVAFTLPGFYLQETDLLDTAQALLTAPPPFSLPEREPAVYAGPCFTLLLPGQLLQIILAHLDAWKANRETVLMALRLCEDTDPSELDTKATWWYYVSTHKARVLIL